MSYHPSIYWITQTHNDAKVRVMTCMPNEHERGTVSNEIDALIAGHEQIAEEYRRIKADHGTGPYVAIYREGMILPYGLHQLEDAGAELWSGPFPTWTGLHQFINSNVDLADTSWKWGKTEFEPYDDAEKARIVDAKGPQPADLDYAVTTALVPA